ncbi:MULTISPECIES: hypothetical protein [unclassified Sphingopyxis]|uniref:hypothetical protein n=1 Tax=unclassified Sphingopyxis TaxID=2614943 RepID=UPI0025EFC20F|nr:MULTISPECIES: hypothetical protein [unclassified Sphingopyxis]
MALLETQKKQSQQKNSIKDKIHMIQELQFDEIQMICGSGEVSDIIDSVVEGIDKLADTAYQAGHRLGSALRSLFVE